MAPINPSSQHKAVITGNVVNLSTGNAVTKGTVELDGNRALSAWQQRLVRSVRPRRRRPQGDSYRPGLRASSVVVDVAMDATAVAPLVLLPPLVALSGVITSNYGGTVAGAFVSLSPRLSTERCGAAANPSAPPTALVAGPGRAGPGVPGRR